MNINSNDYLAESISNLNELLKKIGSTGIDLEKKMMKAAVEEKVRTPGSGDNIDVSV